MGEQVWQQTEPPLAIGRGLTAATGVIGSVLGVMLLWAMISTEAGRSAVSTARSTIVNLTENDFSTEAVTVLSSSATSAFASRTTDLGPSTSTHTTGSGSGVFTGPMPTWAVHSIPMDPAVSAPSSADTAPIVLAAPVNGGTVAITTAAAVGGATSVQVELPDGSTAEARVLFVDNRTGLAVLAPNTVQSTEAFTVATDIQPGDELTFVGEQPMSVIVGDDGSIDGSWSDDAMMPEGAPVVNQRGELVALCTHETQGSALNNGGDPRTTPTSTVADSHLITIEPLDDIQQAMSALHGAAPVWVGVVINDDPAGELSVGAVDPSGPAAAAGLVAGDVILALDAATVSDGRALIAHLGRHRPGDTVSFSVRRSDGTTARLSVTLAAPKTTL